MEIDLGEVLDPFRRHVIDIKDALAHARYRYDGLDLIGCLPRHDKKGGTRIPPSLLFGVRLRLLSLRSIDRQTSYRTCYRAPSRS